MRALKDLAERAVALIEGQGWLDKPSYKLEHGIGTALNLLGGAGRPVRDLLHGTWLGHPLHPVLINLPVGAWTVTAVLDGVDALAPGSGGVRDAARTSVGIGLVGAAGAAVAGLNDWQYTEGGPRRLGLVHGLLNTIAFGACTASWLERRRGRHERGRLLGGAGYAMTLTSAYLGGVLVYRHRIGVDHADRQLEPRDFVAVLPAAELAEGRPRAADAGGVTVVLVRSGGRIHALGGHCAHQGGPLAEGVVHHDGISCPWHGSRFALATGQALNGPATTPLPCFETRIRDGRVEVRRRPRVPTAPPGAVIAREQRAADARH
jgi:nitrite reductase/ring-hydroxylating ferredoxin subunit/uncharacterized membrane protein